MAMSMPRRQHRAQSKAMRALEAVKERRTVNELAADSGVHPAQISQGQRQLLEGLSERCSSRRRKRAREEEVLQAELDQEMGRLKRELEWLNKKVAPFTHGKTRDDGVGASRAQREASRCLAGVEAGPPLLWASAGKRRALGADAGERRTRPPYPLLR